MTLSPSGWIRCERIHSRAFPSYGIAKRKKVLESVGSNELPNTIPWIAFHHTLGFSIIEYTMGDCSFMLNKCEIQILGPLHDTQCSWMCEKEIDFLANLYLPDQISFDEIMWDEDIPSFIQALTTLDDRSFISGGSPSSAAKPTPLFYNENKEQDCRVEQYDVSSPGAISDSSTAKGWEEIPVKQWTCMDVLQWLKHTLIPFGIDLERNVVFEHFRNTDGLALSSMTLSDFVTCSSTFGSFLYDKLQTFLRAENSVSNLHQLLPVQSDYKNVSNDVVSLMLSESQLTLPSCLNETLVKPKLENSAAEKKKPGRPKGAKRRKQTEQRLGRLWEFIRDLLLSEKYCPKYICWDNYEEGKFRFVESDKVAKLWGSIKGNANMNYEKFSRAMRYYYKSEVLLPVEGRRLVYKFGPKATGWRTNNPNFQL